jgi:hypothetical protein
LQLTFCTRKAETTAETDHDFPPYPKNSEDVFDLRITWILNKVVGTIPIPEKEEPEDETPEKGKKSARGKDPEKGKNPGSEKKKKGEESPPPPELPVVKFSIDRKKNGCRTPARNKEVEEALSYFAKIFEFSDKVIPFLEGRKKKYFCFK